MENKSNCDWLKRIQQAITSGYLRRPDIDNDSNKYWYLRWKLKGANEGRGNYLCLSRYHESKVGYHESTCPVFGYNDRYNVDVSSYEHLEELINHIAWRLENDE